MKNRLRYAAAGAAVMSALALGGVTMASAQDDTTTTTEDESTATTEDEATDTARPEDCDHGAEESSAADAAQAT